MTSDWSNFLSARGATLDNGVVRDFGDAAAELDATAAGGVMADLSHLGLLGVTGADAEAFLHGQLSCDVGGLEVDGSTFGSYCSPKGRMLASFLLWREADGFAIVLSRTLVVGIERRLRMFVLRSKATVADRSAERVLIGAAGDAAESALRATVGIVPQKAHRVARSDGVTVVRVPANRFLVTAAPERAEAVWAALSATLRPVGTPCWEWLDITAGMPLVTARTQDELVPQMANLELIGGVSFEKGCYPGQEVVARTQFRGKTKRRMFLARVQGAAPAPGDPLYSEDLDDQASGAIVNAAPAPGGGFDVLAVVHTLSAADSTVHLGSPDGAPLRFRPLPYHVP
ncbi:MAG TPA: folate-binding protein [Burkholderiales bacterium]|nr:folate-binding protein [Burkholderiales bacterium]